jgi:hypothetical protein
LSSSDEESSNGGGVDQSSPPSSVCVPSSGLKNASDDDLMDATLDATLRDGWNVRI